MSNTLNLHFIHPTDGRRLTARLDESMTAQEAINELIGSNWIPASAEGYKLAVKGGAELNQADTFGSRSVSTESMIRVIPATDAGGAIA